MGNKKAVSLYEAEWRHRSVHRARGVTRRRAVVNTVMNFRVPQEAGVC
jgi:hypothetical protein